MKIEVTLIKPVVVVIDDPDYDCRKAVDAALSRFPDHEAFRVSSASGFEYEVFDHCCACDINLFEFDEIHSDENGWLCDACFTSEVQNNAN